MTTIDSMSYDTPTSTSCDPPCLDDQRSRIILMDLSLRDRRESLVGKDTYHDLEKPHDALLLPPGDEDGPSADFQKSRLLPLSLVPRSWRCRFESSHCSKTTDYPAGFGDTSALDHQRLNATWHGDAPRAQFIADQPGPRPLEPMVPRFVRPQKQTGVDGVPPCHVRISSPHRIING